MKNKFFRLISTVEPQASQPPLQAASKKRFGKKIYATLGVAAIIVVVLAGMLLIPQSTANVVPLGVHYSVGEELTYNITTSVSTQGSKSSTSFDSQGTLNIEVVSLNGDTYTLNYSTTTAILGYSTTSSKLLDVKESDMINVLTLLPVALQQYANSDVNDSNPTVTAIFNQSQAKVGDTWQIPLTANTNDDTVGNLTVTFKAIQDLTVPAGNFKVFRIDFSTNTLGTQSSLLNINLDVAGQSYLEYGTSKQIQSNLQLNMNSGTAINNYNIAISISSTLTKDVKP